MQQQKSFEKTDSGTLYLVPTPIGNLEDMTFRAVSILNSVSLIACEDTRHTKKLLNHFAIHTPQISCHEHNINERLPQLLARLQQGDSIAQVSDAGMPSISDPGHELVKACIEQHINVVALPGASAGVTALIASGLAPQPFYFYGFLKRKKSEQTHELEQLKTQTATLIFYESPFRLKDTLANFVSVFDENRQAVICRELTKTYEEYTRGTLLELSQWAADTPLKGEICLLVSGCTTDEQNQFADGKTIPSHLSHQEAVDWLMREQHLSSKEAIKWVAKDRQISKQTVYKDYHKE